MNKQEYIDRYGEEAYEEFKEQCRKWKKEKYHNRSKTKKQRERERVDSIEIKVDYVVDYSKEIARRNEDEYRMAAEIQKRLKNWWRKQVGESKMFILVVDAGSVVNRATTFPFKISLTQLNLQDDEIEAFKVGAAEITKEILENLQI